MGVSATQVKVTTATFRFYAELNDFLPLARRYREFAVRCARAATSKHMIEALGVPHTEVELILINGESVGFDCLLRDADRVAVYPRFETFDITLLLRVRERPLRTPKFVADAHLGGLARLMRMAGFDTLYDNAFDDVEITEIARREARIVLTRDRELLKRRDINHGCFVRTLQPQQQLREIIERLDLAGQLRPFSLCLVCNAPLLAVDKASVLDSLPPSVRAHQEKFTRCPQCQRVYWPGSHWQRMRHFLDAGLSTGAAAAPDHPAPAPFP